MNAALPFVSYDRPCADTVQWLRRRLSPRGLRVLQTFDLQHARLATADCPCPHHGTTACDCQMVILLVYSKAAAPVTLVLHSNDGRTWISLVNTPAQRADAALQTLIEKALEIHPRSQGL